MMNLAIMSYTLGRGVKPENFDIPGMCKLAPAEATRRAAHYLQHLMVENQS